MAVALFACILDRVPAPRRGPWDSFAHIIPERGDTVEGQTLTSTPTSGVQGAKPPCRGLGCPQHTSLSHVCASAGGKL